MKQALTIRLTPEARTALERLAQQDDRSMSSMLNALIKEKAVEKGLYTPQPLRSAVR
jgi:predicted transcriptional regulator